MKREDAISSCRYYKGEEKPPVKLNDVQANVWKIESYWVDMVTSEDDEVFRTILNQYLSANLRLFCRTDNVPITLKALLYNRYLQYNEGMGNNNEFKKWYEKNYSH